MYKVKKNNIRIDDIAVYLNKMSLLKKEFEIIEPSGTDNMINNSIIYLEKAKKEDILKLDCECLILMNPMDFTDEETSLIVPDIIFTETPEKDFYLIVKEFFIQEELYTIHSSVKLNDSVEIGVNVNIAEGSKIGKNVTIKSNTFIGKNVIINDNITIGSGCYLKDNSIIGSESFDFISEDKRYSYIPFLGKLVIGNDVWIGSNVILERPSLNTKYIKDSVKIDDLVQIGSDVNIDNNTQIAAGSIIGKKVNIGSNCALGINTVVKPDIIISDNVITGIGAVVIKNLDPYGTYVGNPAKKLR